MPLLVTVEPGETPRFHCPEHPGAELRKRFGLLWCDYGRHYIDAAAMAQLLRLTREEER